MTDWKKKTDVLANVHAHDAILIADHFTIPLYRDVKSASLAQIEERGPYYLEPITPADAALLLARDPHATVHARASGDQLAWFKTRQQKDPEGLDARLQDLAGKAAGET